MNFMQQLREYVGNASAAWRARRGRVLRAPVVLQIESLECGAASLSIVLRYYKKFIPLEQLRLECGVTRDGSKASNVLKAARKLGLNANGYKKEPAELRDMPLPLIVFWNFNHFLVVEGFRDGKVFLNDPACGRRTVSNAEFDQSFTGVVLSLQPGPEFVPSGRQESVYRALFKRMTGDHSAVAFLVLAGLFMVLPGMVIPVFTTVFVDRVLVGSQQSWQAPILIGLALAALLAMALSFLQGYYLMRMQTKLALSSASRFFWHVLNLPQAFYAQRSPGEISSRVALNDTVSNVIAGDLAKSIINGLLAFFFIIVMLNYDAWLTLASVTIVIANLAFFQYAAQRTQEMSIGLSIAGGKLQGVTTNGLMALETLRATAAESGFFSKFAGFQAQYVAAHQQMEGLGLLYRQIPAFLMLLNDALILCFGGYRVIEGHLTIGMLIAFQGLVHNFTGPMSGLFGLMDRVQRLRGDVQRLDDVLDYDLDPIAAQIPLHTPGEAHKKGAKLSGDLELRGVSFGYNPNDAPLLNDFHMKLAPGERVAIVGPSGCGKSTVAKVVMGIYQPNAGEILFDGQPRSAYGRFYLANSLALVDQDISLFEGTFRDNLTMWDAGVPERDMIQAAKDALIHDFIMSRPGGYDSPVAEGGRNMSGGQKQRLEIARALVTNPRILVLDEATSALDTGTEEQIEQNLRRRGCSCVVVAHRLSTIRDCNLIIVLSQGVIVEQGTHEELVAIADGHYRTLVMHD